MKQVEFMTSKNYTFALVGSGGAGVAVTGEILLKAAGYSLLFGILRKSFGPQIRGGESAAILRLSDQPVMSLVPSIQMIVAIDWKNFSRFQDEIPVESQTLVICDDGMGEPPDQIKRAVQVLEIPFSTIAKEQGSSRINMVVLGFIGKLLEFPLQSLVDAMMDRLYDKDQSVLKSAVNSITAGYEYEFPVRQPFKSLLKDKSAKEGERWLLSGNKAISYGVLSSGIRFVSAYPITPASDALEWIAEHIEYTGGHLVQAEDELSAINMAIGASFGGVPALTITSGPGMSLMIEALGLAVASETPVVVIDVMRGGPSTGIPTKSEQSDLNLAIYGMHGDAPHIVIAPMDIQDCVLTGAWAVYLAESLQTVVIVLSDQILGQSQAIISKPEQPSFKIQRLRAFHKNQKPYLRYLDTDSGVSPMAIPGEEHTMYTAEGLEHNQRGLPSPKAGDHSIQLQKRQNKIDRFDYGDDWGVVSGLGSTVVCCWGSVSSAAREAQSLLAGEGIQIKLICLRLLNPLPVNNLNQSLDGADRIFIIEQNHSAQFYHYVKSRLSVKVEIKSIAIPGPVPISAYEIVNRLKGAGQ